MREQRFSDGVEHMAALLCKLQTVGLIDSTRVDIIWRAQRPETKDSFRRQAEWVFSRMGATEINANGEHVWAAW
jgi:hypothetical protein